ncbi:unnamed protein product, partial [Mesorhabditis spiculigera]
MFGLLIILLTCLVVYYLIFATIRKNFWKSRKVPGPPGSLIAGNFFELFDQHKPWAVEIMKYTKKYGRVWGYMEGVMPALVIADPKIAHEVYTTRYEEFQSRKGNQLLRKTRMQPEMNLLDARGARWKRLRTIANPQFSSNSLKRLLKSVSSCSDILVQFLEKEVDKPSINIHRFYQEFSMDVINRIALGDQTSSQWQNDWVDGLKLVFEHDNREPFMFAALAFPSLRPMVRVLNYLKMAATHSKLARLVGKVFASVQRRRDAREKHEQTPDDFLNMFLDLEDPHFSLDYDQAHDRAAERDMKAPPLQKVMTEKEILGSVLLFLFAGFDTTANSLGYVTHHLARHRDVQQRLREDIQDTVVEGEDLTFEHLAEMKYLDCVVKESLRLHPTATKVSARIAERETELAGIHLPKGTMIQIDCYSMQRDPKLWGDDAEEFNPERWYSVTPEQQQAYVPFGAGPRMCVGQRLGLNEVKLALAKVLLNFDIFLPDGGPQTFDIIGAVTVAPVSINVKVKRLQA